MPEQFGTPLIVDEWTASAPYNTGIQDDQVIRITSRNGDPVAIIFTHWPSAQRNAAVIQELPRMFRLLRKSFDNINKPPEGYAEGTMAHAIASILEKGGL